MPTKERVFAKAVALSGTPASPSYVPGVSQEIRIGFDLKSFMDTRGIRYLDLLPVLEDAISRGEAIFPPNADGHFTPAGYRVIAEAVAPALAAP